MLHRKRDEDANIYPRAMPTTPTPCHESSPSSCSPSSLSFSSSSASAVSSSSSFQTVRSGSPSAPEAIAIAIDPVTFQSSLSCEPEAAAKMAVTSTRQLRPRARDLDQEQDSIHNNNRLSRPQSKGKRGTSVPAVNLRKTAKKEENKRAKGEEVEDEGEDNAQLKVDESQTQLADDHNSYGKEKGHSSISTTRVYFRWAWIIFWLFIVWQVLVKAMSCRNVSCYTDISLHLGNSQCEFIVVHRDSNTLTVKVKDGPEYVAESQLPKRGKGATGKAAQTNQTTRSKTFLPPNRNTKLERNASEKKVRNPTNRTMSPPLVQSSSSTPSCESTLLGPHLIHVTESMQHACFPLPSFSWLASQLNKHSLQLHAHTPFTAQGPAILTFLNSTAAALTNLSATISPRYQVFRQLEFYQEAANASPTEEDAKHYLAAAAENFALIKLRAGNERWEKLVFDSAALETLLQNIAGDFISFGIIARSFEARLDLDLRELSSIIRTQLEEEEEEINWREEDMAYRSAPSNMDIDSERFEQIVQGVDNVIHSAQAFIRTWRRGVDELSRKQAIARAQLEPFITAMSSEEKAVGFEGLELGAFYTPWMKGQLSRNRIYDPHCREEILSRARGFWLPETEDRFLLVKEMTDIVNDLENRWDAVVDHLKRMKQSVRVRARRTEKGWKDGWTWTSWIR